MKILIRCEDSVGFLQSIVRDLHYAGLPARSHVRLLLPMGQGKVRAARIFAPVGERAQIGCPLQELEDWGQLDRVKAALERHFPNWFIEPDDQHQSEDAIGKIARDWRSDLVLVGSNTFPRLQHTSTLVQEYSSLECNIRIVHPRHQHPDARLNILAWVNGEETSVQMLEHLTERAFPRNACVHLLNVVRANEWNLAPIHHMLDYFSDTMRTHFLRVESQIRYGAWQEQILRYTHQQEIDAIFLPRSDPSDKGELAELLGVAHRAQTTVEVYQILI